MSSPGDEGDGEIRRAQLQMQFQGTRRGDFQTTEAYVKRLKSIANSLTEIGSPISDSDMVLQLLVGLPSGFLSFIKTILSMSPLPNFEEACSMVYKQEAILFQDHGEQDTTDPGVVDQEQSSAFCTGEKFNTVVDTLSTVVGVVSTVSTVVAAVGAFPAVVGAAGAVGAASAIAASVVGAASAASTLFSQRDRVKTSPIIVKMTEQKMSFPSDKLDDSNSIPKTEMGSKDERIIAQQLKMQFLGTRKGDGETIESYVQNLKSTADSLTAIGSPVSDQDLVLQLLAGLPPPQYMPYQNRISSEIPLPDFQGACSLLYMYESLLQEQKANPTSSTSSDSPLEEGNYSKETFDKFVDVFSTASGVATLAWDIWSMCRTSSTTAKANTGNKKFTKRRNGRRGKL